MPVDINKIQFFSHRDSEAPIFYCHSSDLDHSPSLGASVINGEICVATRVELFKVKANPQTKDRVDIYLPVGNARQLGVEVLALVPNVPPNAWRISNANPHAAAQGRMALPGIEKSYYGPALRVEASTRSGITLRNMNCWVNIDLEIPHGTHIRMAGPEVHIGIRTNPPIGRHDFDAGEMVEVPVSELQRGTNESNPVQKVEGKFWMTFDAPSAAGLGQLLSTI